MLTSMTLRKALTGFWGVTGTVGILLLLFGGVSHTVQDASECPETWEDANVIAAEVFGPQGEPAGYWCLVEGSISRSGVQNYHTLPIGESDGFPTWYGFLSLAVAVTGFGLTRLLTKPAENLPVQAGELS